MKTNILLVVFACTIIFSSCDMEDPFHQTDNYTSLTDFYAKKKPVLQSYTINSTTGGSFTSPQGTVVTIPPNCFITESYLPVTGEVVIKFKDLFKKSDMLLSDISTTSFGRPLKSGGEFFIQAFADNDPVLIGFNKKINVALPVNQTGGIDTMNMQKAFVLKDTANANVAMWDTTSIGSLTTTTSNYVFSLYQFSSPVKSGTWCNSDNAGFFNAYPQTTLTLVPGTNTSSTPDVFLIFKTVNTMIHVYRNGMNYPYQYAPVGLECTAVAISEKDGKLYSAFVPVTITANKTVDLNLTETTTDVFIAALNALN
jgi:hypothetical protein